MTQYCDKKTPWTTSLFCGMGHYGQIIFSVFNTGTGVSDNRREKIFDRFYRVDKSRSRETGGFGIGLSIAKAIADAHGGMIEVAGVYLKWIRFDLVL